MNEKRKRENEEEFYSLTIYLNSKKKRAREH